MCPRLLSWMPLTPVHLPECFGLLLQPGTYLLYMFVYLSIFELLLDCLLTIDLHLAIRISALTSEAALEVEDHCAGHV